MSALWAWFLSTTVGRWIVGIGAVLAALAVAIASAFLYGRRKGTDEQATADKAKDAEAAQQAAQEAVTRAHDAQEIENAIAKQPDAGTQQVGTAKPGTSAGELREHWMRPDAVQDDHPATDKG